MVWKDKCANMAIIKRTTTFFDAVEAAIEALAADAVRILGGRAVVQVPADGAAAAPGRESVQLHLPLLVQHRVLDPFNLKSEPITLTKQPHLYGLI